MWPEDTPWSEAEDYVTTEQFQNHWANKLAAIRPVFEDEQQTKLVLPGGSDGVLACLAEAQRDFANQEAE
jgi:hypothetical protein